MSSNQIRSRVKALLEESELCRNSDKHLTWRFWEEEGTVEGGFINKERWMSAALPESITRLRRDVQQEFPELKPTEEEVVERRHMNKIKWKEEMNGTKQGEFL